MALSFTNDACDLLVDDRWSLNIVRIREEGRIVLSTVVMDSLPDEVSYAALTDMLGYALNPMFGNCPVVGVDPQTDAVVDLVAVTRPISF